MLRFRGQQYTVQRRGWLKENSVYIGHREGFEATQDLVKNLVVMLLLTVGATFAINRLTSRLDSTQLALDPYRHSFSSKSFSRSSKPT